MHENTGIHYPAMGEMAFIDLGDAPDPEPTQVVIRTHYSGITNGTERHALLGEHGWDDLFPGAHGYQCVGRIEKAGAGVTEFKEGDWVFYGAYVGHRGWHVQDVASADTQSNASHLVFKLPSGIDHKHCALLGVAGVAMRGVRRFRVGPAQKVWVAGQGPIGHFAAQSARALGAHVTVSDLNSRRLETAQICGAHRAINAAVEKAWTAIEDGGPYDCIIDACNLDSFLLDVFDHNVLAHGGVNGILAVHTKMTFPWSLLHTQEASIEVSCHFSLDELRVLTHFMQQGIIQVGPVISHCVPVAEAPTLYGMLRDDPGRLMGVVFDWTG
ncbi:MAG: zinc-binding dehydrogenase [bacterium]|nr:zinc-binding dehydrogenase [bacterium]